MFPKESFNGRLYKKCKDLISITNNTIKYQDLSQFTVNQELLNLLACCLNNKELTPPLITNQVSIPFSEITSHRVTQFISIQGVVCKMGNIHPISRISVYSCKICNTLKTIFIYKDEKPTKCDKIGCKSKHFHSERDHIFVKTINVQSILIQQNLFEGIEGRVPKKQQVLLLGEALVDQTRPGDFIKVSGVLLVDDSVDNLYNFVIHANSIEHESKQLKSSRLSNDTELQQIEDLINSPNIVAKLINSFCIQIIGMEEVKFGLLLSLFGASKRNNADMRSQIHVLLLGEPGKGKSVLLNAMGVTSPRGFYVCGSSGVTSTGLTLSLNRDGNDFAIEAGPLVLADKGHCIIDELDKLPDKNALLEVMEQGEVRMAKAGMKIHLKARTSVVCAANPKGGHFTNAKLLHENVNIPFPLFSRFDLVFPLFDTYNANIVDNIIENRGNVTRHPDIPLNVFQAIIKYSRDRCHPVLSEEAKLSLKAYYLKLRGIKYHTTNPITIRHLESMIRLSEARAKMEFKRIVTKEHADDIIELLEATMFKHLQTGLQIHSNASEVPMKGKMTAYKRMIQKIQEYSQIHGNSIKQQEIKEIAGGMQLVGHEYHTIFDRMNEDCYITKKQDGSYKIHS